MSEKNIITSDDILGKEVIDSEGAVVGIIDKLMIDPNSITLTAISIDKGFLKKGLVVGIRYIQRIGNHAVFLSIRPSMMVKNMAVFDAEGVYIGQVVTVSLQGIKNTITDLVVKAGKRQFHIPGTMIATIRDSVILKEKRSKIPAVD